VKRGVKRALESGPTPKELGSTALLEELKRGTIPPTIVAPGLYLIPHLSASDGRLLHMSLTEKGPLNIPRLVRLDHMGIFQCLCGQRVCKDHDVSMLREAASIDGFCQSAKASSGFGGAEGAFETGGVGGVACALEGSEAFVREVTMGTTRVLPIKLDGQLGEPLIGLNAEAWSGPRLRMFVVSNDKNGTGEVPTICTLAGKSTYCSNCQGEERCRHVVEVQAVLREGNESDPALSNGNEGRALTIQRGQRNQKGKGSVSKKRAERVALRASGQKALLVCNDVACRGPESNVPCMHNATLESWECLSAAAMDMGHSHKKIDTVMSNGGKCVTSLCER
jgi:hypothetical protein